MTGSSRDDMPEPLQYASCSCSRWPPSWLPLSCALGAVIAVFGPQVLLAPPRPDSIEFGGLRIGWLLASLSAGLALYELRQRRTHSRWGLAATIAAIVISVPIVAGGLLFAMLSLFDY
jgi:hypothetical protein